jgi:hypothetical protein
VVAVAVVAVAVSVFSKDAAAVAAVVAVARIPALVVLVDQAIFLVVPAFKAVRGRRVQAVQAAVAAQSLHRPEVTAVLVAAQVKRDPLGEVGLEQVPARAVLRALAAPQSTASASSRRYSQAAIFAELKSTEAEPIR